MEDDKLFRARLADLASAAESGKTRFSAFLGASARDEAARFFSSRKIAYYEWGGNEKCERAVLGVSPRELSRTQFPVAVIRAAGHGAGSLSHRDLLGAVMSAGLERDAVGDLVPDSDTDEAYLFVTREAARLLINEMNSAGGVSLSLSLCDGEKLLLPEKRFDDLSLSVSSLRADALLAALLKVSREKACEIIDSGAVVLDGRPLSRHEKEASAGSVLSVRGYGRFSVDYAAPSGRKGRISYLVKKYK